MPPKQAVNAPPLTPPFISLLTSTSPIDSAADRWEGGFSYEPETCDTTSTGIDDPCDVGTQTITTGTGSVDIEPFLIFAGDACSPWGFNSRDWKGRASRKLAACESHLIEDELWRGTQARASSWGNKWLTHPDVDELSSTSLDPTEALACLEQGLAECNCGARGMIHATRQVVTHWVANNLVRRENRMLMTELGTIVVPGSGYDGSKPALDDVTPPPAATSGEIWAYATGLVSVRLGPVQISPASIDEAMNRSTNLITFRAERMAAYSWDCCHLGVPISLTLCEIEAS